MPIEPYDTDQIARGAREGPPVVPALAGYTGHLLRAAFVAAQDYARDELPGDTQPREFGMLAILAGTGPLSQQQLGELLDVNRTVMVHVADRLEAAGLLERRRNPADRRSYALQPTAEGLAWLARIAPAIQQAEAGFTAPLEEGGRERLNALLRRLLEGLGHEPPAPVADRTGYLLAATHMRIRDRFEGALDPLGLDPRQFGALATIVAAAPCTQQLVAQQLGVTGPVVVQIVDELEAAGLVERRRNPADRRSYALQPTAKGRATLRRTQAIAEALGAEIAEPLGADGDKELKELLRKLLRL
jgi:DNA-binding MarR family transcriptional regulator